MRSLRQGQQFSVPLSQFAQNRQRSLKGIDSPCHTDASSWLPGRVGRAPAWLDCGGPRADWRGGGCAGPHEGESGAAAVAGGSGRGKDNIDTSHRSSSSPRPGPAPQSWPAGLRTRTSHHPFEHHPLAYSPPSMARRGRLKHSRLFGIHWIRRRLGTKNGVSCHGTLLRCIVIVESLSDAFFDDFSIRGTIDLNFPGCL